MDKCNGIFCLHLISSVGSAFCRFIREKSQGHFRVYTNSVSCRRLFRFTCDGFCLRCTPAWQLLHGECFASLHAVSIEVERLRGI